mmetsp:Transcript_29045/g.54354  ORF Transcript_29045/g.54354 Transcript_29045/m.54354 type:complete len:112 (-) Transcript_29045:104-439(-)
MLSTKTFNKEAARMFEHLQKGLEPMSEMNEGFQIEKSGESMSVTIGPPGSYMFQMDSKKKGIQMFSPISTTLYTYKFDENSQQWISEQDGHLMIELLTRELLQSCSGLPDL